MTERLPWMKFWPRDWRADAGLRSCSMAARGLWIEMISLMHDAEPYGHLLINGRAPTPRIIAGLVNATEKDVRRWLAELEESLVFDRDGEAIVSRRMVRDDGARRAGQEAGRKGGNPSLRRGAGEGVNPQGGGEEQEGITPPVNPGVNPPTNPPVNPLLARGRGRAHAGARGCQRSEEEKKEQERFALSSDPGSDTPAPVPGEEATPAKPDPVDEALDAWAAVCVPAGLARITKATPPRRRAIAARLRDDFGGDVTRWRAYLARIAASGFLTGAGERGWRADLDWAVKPANVVRVLEGFHDDRQPREVPAGPARVVDERYFGRPAREVRALPKPPGGTPERDAWDNAVYDRPTPHPRNRTQAPIA